MGQARTTRAEGAPDTVITGAVVLDHWGIVKADIGIRDGRITAHRQGGQPRHHGRSAPRPRHRSGDRDHRGQREDPHRGRRRHPRPLHLPRSSSTRPSPPASPHSSAAAPDRPRAPRPPPSRPAPGTSPGCSRRWTACPSTSGCSARATPSPARRCCSQLRGGALGFKIHEDWGATPAVIDACLSVCEETGAQLAIHTDTLNEAGFVEDTLAAIAGRGIHAYHTEGAGGGHAPDIITVVSEPNVLPVSTNPTRPHTVNTVEEHLDMLMVCHHLNPAVPEDLAFAESRIRPSTIAAEDILHDLGAISIISSDAQAMGRIGEVVLRTWQTAHVMKQRRGALPGDGTRRQPPRPPLCRQIHHQPRRRPGPRPRDRLRRDGQARRPGAVGAGVLRRQAATGHQGRADRVRADGRRQRLHPHPAAGPAAARCSARIGRAPAANSFNFVAEPALEDGLPERLGLGKRFVAIRGTRARHQGRHAGERRPAARSRSTPTPSPSPSTARWSNPRRPPNCPWPSATSSSEAGRPRPVYGA